MAALGQDANRPKYRVSPHLKQRPLLGGVAFEVYKGAAMVSPTANLSFVRNNSGNAVATDVFAGIAAEAKSVKATDANGAQAVGLHIDGVHAFPKGALTVADIGKNVYVLSTDNDLSLVSTNALWIGVIDDVDATFAYVDITLAAGSVNVAK